MCTVTAQWTYETSISLTVVWGYINIMKKNKTLYIPVYCPKFSTPLSDIYTNTTFQQIQKIKIL